MECSAAAPGPRVGGRSVFVARTPPPPCRRRTRRHGECGTRRVVGGYACRMNATRDAASAAYDLAIFDFDGTLADSFPFFLRLHNRLAQKHGFRKVAPEDVPALRAMSTRELMARSGLPAWRLPAVARDFTRHMQETDEVVLFAGIPETLRALAAHRLRLALVTSNSRPNIERVLGPSLLALFGHVDCGASIFGKRSRLQRAARIAGVPPARSIYVGDATADAEAAHAAGMHFGAVDWGYTTPEALAACGPALRFTAVQELLSLGPSHSG